MSSKPGRGTAVNIYEVSRLLEPTRRMRLALNVLVDGLCEMHSSATTEPMDDALRVVHDKLTEIETTSLLRSGQPDYYLIVRPANLVNPPPPKVMEEVSAAVRTLARHGMLVGQDDALFRDGS